MKYGHQVPKNSFAMKLRYFVESEGLSGFIADVVRELEKKEG